MGLLSVGKPLTWEEAAKHRQYVREHGLRQFLATFARVKDISNDRLFYGDEVEYALLKVDNASRSVRLSLRGSEVLEKLREREKEAHSPTVGGCTWHQEYGSWMLEGTPAIPYGGYTASLLQVENNMRLRRSRVIKALAEDEIAPTMVNFPLMGVGHFVDPPSAPGGAASDSAYVPDACINPHPRFPTLTRNIRARKGSKVDIKVPIFQETQEGSEASPSSPADPIHMDCMAFGMGCCCLQVTFQASDVDESRYLYDQGAALAPILLALTAASPIYKGCLSDIDVRWKVVSGAVDDRTPAELGLSTPSTNADPQLAGGGVQRLSKSRYDSISCYIQNWPHAVSSYYNDIPCEVDEDMRTLLLKEGIDTGLARHLAHLFVRDPLVIFEGAVSEVDDNCSVEHFDNINSTNWQTVRWKPPPPKTMCGPHIGWRTEFRPMEVQLTDFENAAFTAFIVLLTRVLLVFNLDMLIPLSKVDENMHRAHQRDASRQSKFWFRKCVTPEEVDCCTNGGDLYEEMTMGEIMTGKGCYFPGLIPLCYAYLEHIQCDSTSFARISQYLTFIQDRACGKLLTPASWIRQFVREHPEYKKDSKLTPGIAFDLCKACDEIGRGVRACPELHGDVKIEPIANEAAYGTLLQSTTSDEARSALIRKICARASEDDGPWSKPSAPTQARQRQSSPKFVARETVA
mmetsp:Transcript_57468/g.136650  ORF Transcript_57468/g.136650 Transcript_57468/m.136650 type:complete len:687 (+) Transcript_57468:42-2102(+)